MRVVVILAALPLLGAAPVSKVATAAPPTMVQPAAPMPVQNPYAERNQCPETPMSLARKQGVNPRARPLSELPPAQAFMAVDRRVGGCAVPMLMNEATAGR
jgi:hypothetical protein